MTWNKKDYNEYIQTTVFPQPNAYGYENLPEIMFIPQPIKDEGGFITNPAQGGGARAFAILDNGEIIDLILLAGGSEYLISPKVYVTYGYDVVKSNKNLTTAYFNLGIESQIVPGLRLSNIVTVIIPTLNPNIYNTSIPFVSPLSSTHQGISYIYPEMITGGNELRLNETRVDVIINLSANISSFSDIYSIIRIHLETPLADIQSISSYSTSLIKNAVVITGSVDSYGDENYSTNYDQYQLGSPLGYYDFNGLQFSNTGIDTASAFTLEMVDNFFPTLTIGDFETRFDSNYSDSKEYWNVGRDSVTEYGAILQIPMNETDTIVYIEDTSRFPSSGSLLIGDELITYTSKLSDRFLGVTRGVNGTIPQSHSAGDYLRTQSDSIEFTIPTVIDGDLYSLPSYYYTNQETYKDIVSKTVLTRTGSFILE